MIKHKATIVRYLHLTLDTSMNERIDCILKFILRQIGRRKCHIYNTFHIKRYFYLSKEINVR